MGWTYVDVVFVNCIGINKWPVHEFVESIVPGKTGMEDTKETNSCMQNWLHCLGSFELTGSILRTIHIYIYI